MTIAYGSEGDQVADIAFPPAGTVTGVDHFGLIDPSSAAWPAVVGAVASLVAL